MIFSEKKENNCFVYNTVDVFGEMEFVSPKKLEPKILDQIFLAIFNIKSSSETIEGTIKSIGVSYKFKKAKQWDELDEEEEVRDVREYYKKKYTPRFNWFSFSLLIFYCTIIIGWLILIILFTK